MTRFIRNKIRQLPALEPDVYTPEHVRLGITPVEHSSVTRTLPKQSRNNADLKKEKGFQATFSPHEGFKVNVGLQDMFEAHEQKQESFEYDEIALPPRLQAKVQASQVENQESIASFEIQDLDHNSYVVMLHNIPVFASNDVKEIEEYLESILFESNEIEISTKEISVVKKVQIKIGAVVLE